MSTRSRGTHRRAVVCTADDGPQELSGVLMLVAFLLVLSALGLVVT